MIAVNTVRQFALRALYASDLGIFLGSMLCVLDGELPAVVDPIADGPSWAMIVWFVASLLVWHLALVNAHAYRSHRLSGGFPAAEIVSGSSVGALGVAVLSLLLQPELIRLQVIVQVWLLAVLLTLLARSLLHLFLVRMRRQGRNLRFALVVGSGTRAAELVRRLELPSAGFRVIGHIDDTTSGEASSLAGVEHLGGIGELPHILAARVVDEVFVALPMRTSYDRTSTVIRQCEEQGIPVRIPCDLFVPSISAICVDTIEGLPIISLVPSAKDHWYYIGKRVFDVVVSALLLVPLLPLFIVVALLIKRDSPGPVFFVQQRVGMNKRMFPMLKFRTMQQDSEALQAQLEHLNEVGGPVFKIRDDPRVTRLGRFLRASSIDELPQIINVLLGQMSLVGPRPLPLRDFEGFKLDWQRRRFSVRPGITCLWQISGRSSLQFDQWMSLDMTYIDQRSLLLDLKILLLTIPAVLKRAGAY